MGNRIVFTTYGSLGDLHPYIAIALALKDRGHYPAIATHEVYRSKVEVEGKIAQHRFDVEESHLGFVLSFIF